MPKQTESDNFKSTYRSQRKVVNRLYRNVDGFLHEESDNRRFLTHQAAVYGELTPLGVQRMLNFLQLSNSDVFYDLGSGVGKVVLQVGMALPIRKSIGVELLQSRFESSQRVLAAAKSSNLIKAKQVAFRHESFLDSNISDATVIFLSSTCFSSNLMRLLARKIKTVKKPITLITLRDFDHRHRGFQFIRTLKLDASWSSNLESNVYRVTP